MSRIGKLPLTIPEKVEVQVADSHVVVKGPKGQLSQALLPVVEVELEDGRILVRRKSDQRTARAAHGLTRTLLANMLQGVTRGFRKSLEIQGVGYRVAKSGEDLNFTLGFSHPVSYKAPKGISFTVEGTTRIHVDGIDKQLVGQVAAEIRELRPPEPYKGKGIRYEGEFVRKKLGKAAKGVKK
jgi:large subunit ribosomal protein L6